MNGIPIRRIRRALGRNVASGLARWAARGGGERIRKTGRWLGRLHYALTWPWQRRLRADISRALEVEPRRANRILADAFETNDRAVFEVLCMADPRCDVTELLSHLEVHEADRLRRDGGAVLLGLHMGNGILMASALAHQGLPVHVVYRDPRRLPPGLLGRAIERGGARPLALDRDNPTRSFREMLKVLRGGGLLYVLMDQGNKGEGTRKRFLGKWTNFPNGVPGLAVRSEAPVYPILAESGWPRWQFHVHEPLQAESADALLDAICTCMETAIRREPALWAWHHRRWKRYPFPAE